MYYTNRHINVMWVGYFIFSLNYRSMWCNLVAAAGIVGLACFGGMIVYAKYFDCDPLSSKVSTLLSLRVNQFNHKER